MNKYNMGDVIVPGETEEFDRKWNTAKDVLIKIGSLPHLTSEVLVSEKIKINEILHDFDIFVHEAERVLAGCKIKLTIQQASLAKPTLD